MLITSATFSWSAENGNAEFGVLVDGRNLAEGTEDGLRHVEDLLFETAWRSPYPADREAHPTGSAGA